MMKALINCKALLKMQKCEMNCLKNLTAPIYCTALLEKLDAEI